MYTKFFFNWESLDPICAELDWVVDYIFFAGLNDNREEIRNNLLNREEYMGWHVCQVSNTIAELFHLYK